MLNRGSTGVLLSREPGLYRGNVGKVRTQFIFYEMCPGASRYTGCPASGWTVAIHRHSENGAFHFVKFAHVVKIYVAYMPNLHIDKIPPNLLHFAFDSKSSHMCQDFITWFKQFTDKFHMFYNWRILDRSKTANVGSAVAKWWVFDSRPRGRGFESHRRHCVVVLEQDKFILA